MPAGFTRIRITNVHVWEEIDFEPREDVTFLLGRNGSGKTSLLDAIVLPCDLLRGASFMLGHQWRGSPVSSGTYDFRDLLWNPDKAASWEFWFEDSAGARWHYALTIAPRRRSWRIEAEVLSGLTDTGSMPVLENVADGARLLVNQRDWMPISPGDQTAALTLAEAHPSSPALSALKFLEGVWLFRPDPLLMRGSSTSSGRFPDRYGRDLDSLLLGVAQRSPKDVSDLLSSMEAVCGWGALSADAEGTTFTELGGRPVPLAYASDGQLLAAWLSSLALYPPENGTVVLLDEPGVALAPDVQKLVYGWARELSNNVQVIAATHDIPAANRASRAEVFLAERAPGQASRLTRLDTHQGASPWSGLFPPGEVAAHVMRAPTEGGGDEG